MSEELIRLEMTKSQAEVLYRLLTNHIVGSSDGPRGKTSEIGNILRKSYPELVEISQPLQTKIHIFVGENRLWLLSDPNTLDGASDSQNPIP